MHCLPGTKSLASSYVDAKNRQRTFAVLTVECHVGIFVSVRKWTLGESGSTRFVIGSLLKGEFSIYIEYLSD